MNILQAIVLGAVQGITEFFPISSSGHLVIFQSIFGMKGPQLAFDIFLHLGTLVSVVIFFRKDILKLLGPDKDTLYFLILASVPTFIIAFLFRDAVEALFALPRFTGFMLIATGFFLFAAHLHSKISQTKRAVGIVNSIIIGLAQGVAIIPGISRSGVTIASGMLCGLDGVAACRFSFLLSIPAVAGACLFKVRKIEEGLTGNDSLLFLAGGIAAMLVGLLAIKTLLAIVKNNKLYAFGIYCILAGISVIIFIR